MIDIFANVKDIAAMLSRVKNLPAEHGFSEGSTLFVYQEVIDRNDGAVRVQEYFGTGMSTYYQNSKRK